MEKEIHLLRAALEMKEKQIKQYETWMRDCDRMDTLEHDLEQKNQAAKILKTKVQYLQHELEKTTIQRDAYQEHIDERDACIDGLHDFIDTERLRFERRIKNLWENETDLKAKITDAETTIRDLRASQGRPFVDHRDAPTFKDKAALLQKEYDQLKCKYHMILHRYHTAAEATQRFETEKENRRVREEEEKIIKDRIQKNLDAREETTSFDIGTQTFSPPHTQEKTPNNLHGADVLHLKHQACLQTIDSLRSQLATQKKTIRPIRAHAAAQLRTIDTLRDDAAKMHATIRNLRRGMIAPPRVLRSIEEVLIRGRKQKPKGKKHSARGKK